MIHRIFISPTVTDARAIILSRQIGKRVSIVDVYTIEGRFSHRQCHAIGAMLTNPVSQRMYLDTFIPPKQFTHSFEIGFLPGVTDNVASTVREMIENSLKKKFTQDEGVYTSQITYIAGTCTKKDIVDMAKKYMNPLIQRLVEKDTLVPHVRLGTNARVDTVNLNVSDDELSAIGKFGIRNDDGSRRGPLALDLTSMKAIQAYFQNLNRNPTDVELESLAQTWSEHCKHTIMNSPIDTISEGLFQRYIKKATDDVRKKSHSAKASRDKDFCVSVFSDNSGAISFDRDWVITHKVETHNSPSALDPFGGAITGIVGVNRDCIGFGLGAKPIANTYGFCVGDLDDAAPIFRDKDQNYALLHPRRILSGVVAGVNNGGNSSGIPTPLGFLCVNPSFKGKPLVFVGTVGLIPKKKDGIFLCHKRARPGDYIVIIGGRVGLDGIHGATFSSEALHIGSPATAVQIGDPITQKKLSDLLIKEARDQGLYTSITDNGAGGLSCSVAEMAKESGGCLVNLESVPVKYPGLAPWQIWISESQERMTLAVPKKKWKKLKLLCESRGIEASVIGVFTKSTRCIVRSNNQTVMDLSMNFLHHGIPKIRLKTARVSLPKYVHSVDTSGVEILSHPDIASFSWISEQFDHEVQGTSVVKPLQGRGRVNGDAAVLRPVLSSQKGIILTHALCTDLSHQDPYYAVSATIDRAVAIAVSTGANPEKIALLDNICWSRPKDPKRLWQLKQAMKACYDMARVYGTPFISGKDSMYNDFHGFDGDGNPIEISIPPTILISAIGIIENVQKSVTIDFKFPGDQIYALGESSNVYNRTLYRLMSHAIRKELISSAMCVHHGETRVALMKSAMAGMVGIDAVVRSARVIVSVHSSKRCEFERSLAGVQCIHIGEALQTHEVKLRDETKKYLINTTLDDCLTSYRSTFSGY